MLWLWCPYAEVRLLNTRFPRSVHSSGSATLVRPSQQQQHGLKVVQSAAYFPRLSSSARSGLSKRHSQLPGHAASGDGQGLGSEGRGMAVVRKQTNQSPNPNRCSSLYNRMRGSGSLCVARRCSASLLLLWKGKAQLRHREAETPHLKGRIRQRSQIQLFQRSGWNQTAKTSLLLHLSPSVANMERVEA